MCLAIPSRILEIKNNLGTVDVDGVRKEVSLQLVENPGIGDYVIVHAGFAIHKIDETEAKEALKALRELADTVYGEKKEIIKRGTGE